MRMAKVVQEVMTELLRLKYKVYERRTNRLLDTAERKLINAKEKISEGNDCNVILTKSKVCYFDSSFLSIVFCLKCSL